MICLAELFQDGMVLQREQPVRVWGESDRVQELCVLLNGTELLTAELGKGSFEVYLPPQKACENGILTLRTDDGRSLVLTGIDIGEVWIAGGQSNMEFLLKYDREGELTAVRADDAHLRFYDVGEYAFAGEKEEGLKDGSHWDRWMKFCPEDAPFFSAVGVYFAQRLRAVLQVPVGVVGCNWGGTTASAWLDAKLLREDPKLCVYTDVYDAAMAKLDLPKYVLHNRILRKRTESERGRAGMDKIMKEETRKPANALLSTAMSRFTAQQMGPYDQNRPGGLYEMMVKKIAGFTARGVIWYQGESDADYARIYDRLFRAVIECWRAAWKAELPFLFVQLAPFESWLGCSGRYFPVLRDRQQRVADTEPDVWMASIMDVGSRYDIHPKDKMPVGERLALLAMGKVYHMDVPCDAPVMDSIVRNSDSITIHFANAQDGLVVKTARRSCDEVEKNPAAAHYFRVREGEQEIPCDIKIWNDTVTLSSIELYAAEKVSVSFACRPFLVMTLYNKAGLPAKPFAPMKV